jgi:hypothetical protein
MWWTRFFKQIDFDPGHEPIILCDNKMTTGHIMAENPKMHTNLKHVAIRNSWLRERAERKELAIEWVPTAEMPADGLTKPLDRGRHAAFVKLVGMRDLRNVLDPAEWAENGSIVVQEDTIS